MLRFQLELLEVDFLPPVLLQSLSDSIKELLEVMSAGWISGYKLGQRVLHVFAFVFVFEGRV